MKKLFIVVALALMTQTVSAQIEDSKFSVKVGAGLSSFVGSGSDDAKNTFSYHAGIAYDLNLSDNFSVIPGIDYAVKGFKTDNIDGDDISMSYLQVPIFAAFKFKISDDIKLILQAGPYVSYGLFSSDIDWSAGGKTKVLGDEYDRFDAGAIGGISLDLKLFTVGLEYSHGLKKLRPKEHIYDLPSGFNQTFSLVFSYKL